MEIEFEVVREPKGQIPGLIGIKKQKPAKDRLVELCKCNVAQRWGGTWQTACHKILSWKYSPVFEIDTAKLLLEIEAEEKVSDGRVRKSEIHFSGKDTTFYNDIEEAQRQKKKYICFGRGGVRDLNGHTVCCLGDVIDDMGGSNGE